MEGYKIAIVGSGPAGLSAAGRAAALDREAGVSEPSYILLEARGQPSETIFRYQKGKHVMAEPGYLRLRSDFPFGAGKREAVLDAWNQQVASSALNIRLNSEVVGLCGKEDGFELSLADGETIKSQ